MRSSFHVGWAPRPIARTAITIGLTAAIAIAMVQIAVVFIPTTLRQSSTEVGPVRRPPGFAPAVPLGAPEEWAVWSYMTKIDPLWGRDWPTIIGYLEELLARYPGNPTAVDKLYVAYLEDGRQLQMTANAEGARRRYQQALVIDPKRGEASGYLAALDRGRLP